MMRLLPLLLLAASACAQPAALPTPAASAPLASGVREDSLKADDSWTYFTPYDEVTTDTEKAVLARVNRPGVHVVRLWAPWCGNSRAELEAGLYQSIEDHPDVTFSFVTIWNDGRDGASILSRYGIAPTDDGRVTVAAQPDRGPSADRDLRRTTFLGVPLSWTPTTLVYNRGGKLAYAFAYGEVSPEMLATAITDARNDWHHD